MGTAICDVNKGWAEYFSGLPSGTPGSMESELHIRKLASEGKRIFLGQGNIEMWRKTAEGGAISSTMNVDEIDTTEDVMYFINQKTSWSALQTSAQAVQRLLTAYSVSPVFLEALYSFGTKVTGDDDPHSSLCEEQHILSPSVRETCYILRTYERHGRPDLSNPWSLRQALVYQKMDRGTGRSVWIFVQLFQRCKNALWREFTQAHPCHITSPHRLFLEIILPDWRWYLEYQRQFIREFTEKAVHSSLAQKDGDYEVDFIDCQRLERVLEKLSLSHEILVAIEHIASTLQSSSDCSKSRCKHDLERAARDSHETSMHVNKIRGFMRKISALQDRAERASILLTKLLDYRRMDLLDTKTKKLARLGTEADSQRKHLKIILEKTQVDFQWTKVMTFIATMYLPANLLAAIFSSNLVYVPPRATDSDVVLLSVRNAMGIYFVLSFFLTGLMIAASYFWVRRVLGSASVP